MNYQVRALTPTVLWGGQGRGRTADLPIFRWGLGGRGVPVRAGLVDTGPGQGGNAYRRMSASTGGVHPVREQSVSNGGLGDPGRRRADGPGDGTADARGGRLVEDFGR
jgi:hypothetical protein